MFTVCSESSTKDGNKELPAVLASVNCQRSGWRVNKYVENINYWCYNSEYEM